MNIPLVVSMGRRRIERLAAPLLFLAFLLLYGYTAAPSVLSGDSAEFQMAAALLGVPHPTTYPLFVLLGKLSTLVVPLGDLAWRVTLVSSLCAALAVVLVFGLARRITGSLAGAGLGAIALGLAPGLWNAATIAEAYALLALLMSTLALTLVSAPDLASWRFRLAALLAGMGFSHHGLFVITMLPLLAGYGLWLLYQRRTTVGMVRVIIPQLAILALCFLAGLTPWLYPLIQYARYGPFDGMDYGLPHHYFWGAPQSWGAVFDLLTGGTIRRGIFNLPAPESILATLQMVGRRLLFEFGPVGVLLGLLGAATLWRKALGIWRAAAWIWFATLTYLLLLGPAVADAPVFTLPMLLPWALWIAAGCNMLITLSRSPGLPPGRLFWQYALVTLLVVATLAWGYTRIRVSSKRQLWLYREFGQATLQRLPPDGVVLAHWEQGMVLQYLVQVERQRTDVWIDVVEPGDDPWLERIERRYSGRPVFLVGSPADVAGMQVELVREQEYASLFRLRENR